MTWHRIPGLITTDPVQPVDVAWNSRADDTQVVRLQVWSSTLYMTAAQAYTVATALSQAVGQWKAAHGDGGRGENSPDDGGEGWDRP